MPVNYFVCIAIPSVSLFIPDANEHRGEISLILQKSLQAFPIVIGTIGIAVSIIAGESVAG